MKDKNIAVENEQKEMISIHVYYDKELSEIAGTSEEKIGVPKGIKSADFINYVLARHPKIEQKFKKKKLTFEHEVETPKAEDELHDNDIFVVSTWTMKEMRDDLKEMLEFAIEYFNLPISLEGILSFIFFEERGEADRMELLKLFIHHVSEPNLIPTVYGLVNQTWLFFPHNRLNGRSPVETVQKVVRDKLK